MATIWNSSNGVSNIVVPLVAIVVAIVVAVVVFVEQSQRRIPVQYAKRMVGRKMLGGSSTYIPLKINMAGVIPVIFATSLLTLPHGDCAVLWRRPGKLGIWLHDNVTRTYAPLNIALYTLLIVFFAYFYTAITFNPDEVADNMKKYGGFVPGIRPGQPTADFLVYVLSRITGAGSIYLAIVALMPTLLFVFLGTQRLDSVWRRHILILVGVGLDTVKRIQSQLDSDATKGS